MNDQNSVVSYTYVTPLLFSPFQADDDTFVFVSNLREVLSDFHSVQVRKRGFNLLLPARGYGDS